MHTEDIKEFDEIPAAVRKMVDLYSESLLKQDFSFRILLPRSTDSQHINDLSKKLGMQVQSEIILRMKKLKLSPTLREFRYIHDESHYGWLLVGPYIANDLH